MIVIVALWFPVNFFQWSTRNGLFGRVWLGLLGIFSRDFGWKSIFETSKVDFRTAKGRGLFYIFILAAKIEKRAFLPMKIKFG
jgi:hypothetical protein